MAFDNMPKVYRDDAGHLCERMYSRNNVGGKTNWTKTDFYHCPECGTIYKENELEGQEAEVVLVYSDTIQLLEIPEEKIVATKHLPKTKKGTPVRRLKRSEYEHLLKMIEQDMKNKKGD